MADRKTRLALTVAAVLLPGPWTPVIVLAYLLRRTDHHDQPTPVPAADPSSRHLPHPYASAYAHAAPDPYTTFVRS
ncbi:hypothetical protein [Sciscionella marina]|uniref:hypothetical protein n=1 Tax=Sciscionella marina TaxID=508770 RepID=UPI0003804061|nr:hypothetical protein [Sciscionella marina]